MSEQSNNPRRGILPSVFYRASLQGLLKWMPSEVFIKQLYRNTFGCFPNLSNPQGFNEKLQWLKLHDTNPDYVRWVDKITAKSMAEEVIGNSHIVKLLAMWDKPEDIDFDALPQRCVLKCNHDQGSTVIIDKEIGYNKKEIVEYLNIKLRRNPYNTTRELPYKYVSPKLFCEEYLADNIIDYKFFCFNGVPKFLNIGFKDAHTHITYVSFLDFNWQPMPFHRSDFDPILNVPEKPSNLSSMLELAEKLARGTRFVRIDLFTIEDCIYFSEYTLYPTSGLIQFEPPEMDRVVGSWLKL